MSLEHASSGPGLSSEFLLPGTATSTATRMLLMAGLANLLRIAMSEIAILLPAYLFHSLEVVKATDIEQSLSEKGEFDPLT